MTVGEPLPEIAPYKSCDLLCIFFNLIIFIIYFYKKIKHNQKVQNFNLFFFFFIILILFVFRINL